MMSARNEYKQDLQKRKLSTTPFVPGQLSVEQIEQFKYIDKVIRIRKETQLLNTQ